VAVPVSVRNCGSDAAECRGSDYASRGVQRGVACPRSGYE
jgi:hypothetical protein